MDGLLYKERFDDDGYFHGSNKDKAELHISLQINTDGVSLFHSSSFSIWPVYFIINELPPHLRLVYFYLCILHFVLNLECTVVLAFHCHEKENSNKNSLPIVYSINAYYMYAV